MGFRNLGLPKFGALGFGDSRGSEGVDEVLGRRPQNSKNSSTILVQG